MTREMKKLHLEARLVRLQMKPVVNARIISKIQRQLRLLEQ